MPRWLKKVLTPPTQGSLSFGLTKAKWDYRKFIFSLMLNTNSISLYKTRAAKHIFQSSQTHHYLHAPSKTEKSSDSTFLQRTSILNMGSTKSKLRKEPRSPNQKESPPSYEAITSSYTSNSIIQPSPGFPNTGINASHVPQWRWSNNQCVEWIAAVLTEYYCKERVEAERIAKKFTGFGPRIWQNDTARWTILIEQSGSDMFSLIFEMYLRRETIGGVPTTINIRHFERKQK